MWKGKTPIRQVLVTLKGALVITLNLVNWGFCSLRSCMPEPLWCFDALRCALMYIRKPKGPYSQMSKLAVRKKVALEL